MNKLLLLLREYQDRCWSSQKHEKRFCFDTDAERQIFVRRLNEVEAEYFLYASFDLYKVDVFIGSSVETQKE